MTTPKTGYVDGYVLTIPKKKLAEYKEMAAKAGKVWRKHGALDYKECIGEDLKPMGVVFTFPKMSKARPGELVVFSYIAYKSRKHRDQVNARVMKDPLMNDPKYKDQPMPFDMKRMAYAGFEVLVSA